MDRETSRTNGHGQINSKAEFYRLWHSGVLGNRPHVWRDVESAARSGHTRFGIREIGKAGGGFFRVVHSIGEMKRICCMLAAQGRQFSLDGGVQNETVLLQGEICRTVRGLEGMMAVRSGTDIRAAFREGKFKPVQNLTALTLIREFMDPSSQDDVWDLLDMYPDHTIEFACFPGNVGVLPHRNTIIWEVRNY